MKDVLEVGGGWVTGERSGRQQTEEITCFMTLILNFLSLAVSLPPLTRFLTGILVFFVVVVVVFFLSEGHLTAKQ